jgi:hypothetical protein
MCPNDEIAKVVARAPTKFIGFAKYGKYMPPFSSPQEEKLAMDDLEHSLRDLGLRSVGGVSRELWWPLPPRASSRSSTRSSKSAGHIRRRSSFTPTRRRHQKHRLLQSGAVRAGDPSTSDAKSCGRRTQGLVRRGDEDGSAL